MTGEVRSVLAMFMLIVVATGSVVARGVRLADKGKARCVIVVPAGSMTWEGDDKPVDHWGRIAGLTAIEVQAEVQRRLQRDSVQDLVHCLGKMSGVSIEVVEGLPAKERRVPIFIGTEGRKVFGPGGYRRPASSRTIRKLVASDLRAVIRSATCASWR